MLALRDVDLLVLAAERRREVALAGVEFLEGLDLSEEGLDELDGDVLAVTDDELAEAVASLRAEGVASGNAAGGENQA